MTVLKDRNLRKWKVMMTLAQMTHPVGIAGREERGGMGTEERKNTLSRDWKHN